MAGTGEEYLRGNLGVFVCKAKMRNGGKSMSYTFAYAGAGSGHYHVIAASAFVLTAELDSSISSCGLGDQRRLSISRSE